MGAADTFKIFFFFSDFVGILLLLCLLFLYCFRLFCTKLHLFQGEFQQNHASIQLLIFLEERICTRQHTTHDTTHLGVAESSRQSVDTLSQEEHDERYEKGSMFRAGDGCPINGLRCARDHAILWADAGMCCMCCPV